MCVWPGPARQRPHLATSPPYLHRPCHPDPRQYRPNEEKVKYVPRIYGFKLHKNAYAEQRARRELERERERMLQNQRK